MLAFFVGDERIKQVKNNPRAMHWSQSYLEEVTDAEVLSENHDYVLTRTKFLAPVMIKPSPFRTEEIGETFRFITQTKQNAHSDDGKLYWAKIIGLAKQAIEHNYGERCALHEDYTLRVRDNLSRAFVNLRVYPEENFLMDMIAASVELMTNPSEYTMEASRNSLRNGWWDPRLKKEKRTRTLDEMIESNRADEIELTRNGKKSIVRISSLSDINSLCYDGVVGMEEVKTNYLGEVALQSTFLLFKTKLIECSVPYRT
ncbi:hypothetical protein J4480_05800 [Candidatus Woesearchaeota archaeon]|nr:hypothetical protein [Candidatus Woesearchaeota archaeon]